MAEETKEGEAPAGPKLIMGMPLLLFIFFALNIAVIFAALGFIVHSQLIYKKPPITEAQVETEIQKKVEQKKTDNEPGVFTEVFPQMTINLRGQQGGKPHFASIEVVLLCPSEACIKQVKQYRAVVEDSIHEAISARSFTELGNLETKFRIKHEVLTKTNTLLKGTAVTEVLFSSFLLQ